jgi:hypothetical protein
MRKEVVVTCIALLSQYLTECVEKIQKTLNQDVPSPRSELWIWLKKIRNANE